MHARSRFIRSLLAIVSVLTAAWAAPAGGAGLPESETVMLVAKPDFRDPVYMETILIARPVGQGRHVGFILNKPTNITLAEALPGHGRSKTVRAPLYLGGPAETNAVFALVASSTSPGRGSMRVSADLFLVIARDTLIRVIETAPEHARFFAGAVLWRPGELEQELKHGAWYVLDPERDFVLPETTDGLWQRLVRLADLRENGI